MNNLNEAIKILTEYAEGKEVKNNGEDWRNIHGYIFTTLKALKSKTESVEIDLRIAQEVLEYFGGEEANVTLSYGQEGHSGEGFYIGCTEYPEEGAVYLGMTEDQKTISDYRKQKAEEEELKRTKEAWA